MDWSLVLVTASHAWLDESTLADAILDRIVHGSHKIALNRESMRELRKVAGAGHTDCRYRLRAVTSVTTGNSGSPCGVSAIVGVRTGR